MLQWLPPRNVVLGICGNGDNQTNNYYYHNEKNNSEAFTFPYERERGLGKIVAQEAEQLTDGSWKTFSVERHFQTKALSK